MGVPKQRHTKSRRNKRRMHLFLKKPFLVYCPKCGKPILSHIVCPNCGYYKTKEIIDVLSKLSKKERKKREKAMKIKEKEEKGSPKESLSWEGLSKK